MPFPLRPSFTLALFAAVWLLAAHAAAAEIIHQTRFAEGVVAIDHPRDATRTGSFVGVLPRGWVDDFPGWSTSVATAQVAGSGDDAHLRIEVAAGFGQFNVALPELVEGAHYRVGLQVRNQATGPVMVGLRMRPAPYHFVWSEQVQPGAAWVERSWRFRLGRKPSQQLGIFLNLNGTGAVDVRQVTLERMSSEEVAALVQRPPATLRNLFRNTRFPLGLQSGWNLDRGCASELAASDPAKPGPSGAPSLRLGGSEPCILYSEPFSVAEPGRRNRAALSFTGSGKWRLAMLEQGREIAAKDLAPGAEWQRDGLAFQPDPGARAFALRLSGSGTLWIDSLAAHAGEEARPYESAGACEVALAPARSEIAETRIQFSDEPRTVAYAVTGACTGAVLKATVADIAGRVQTLPDIALTGPAAGTVDAAAFPDAPIGQFRVEAWVERDGVRISPANELVVTCLRRPLFWGKDAPESPFGGHALPVDRTLRMLKAGGINWARLHDAGTEVTGWRWLEPKPGEWHFHDAEVARYRGNHLKLYAQLGTAPKWASHLSKYDLGGYFSNWFQPLATEPYANYVRTVVARYQGVIGDWFVWNEPWNVGWWAVDYRKQDDTYITSAHPQADYVKLAQVAYQAAKAVDPTVSVCAFPVNGGAWGKGLVDAGGLAWTDVIDYHFYAAEPAGRPGDVTEREYAANTAYLAEKTGAITKPVYMGEGNGVGEGREVGEASTDYAGLYRHALPYTSADDPVRMANQTAAYVVTLLARKVTRLFLYSSHCYQNLGSSSFNNALLCNDGYPHPSLVAHANVAWHLEGRPHAQTVELAAGVQAYLFQGADGAVAVLSGATGHAPFTVPASPRYEVRELFGNLLPAGAPLAGTLVFVKSAAPAAELAALLRPRP